VNQYKICLVVSFVFVGCLCLTLPDGLQDGLFLSAMKRVSGFIQPPSRANCSHNYCVAWNAFIL